MKILGLGSPFTHDPAAALVVDGRTIAAAEEERFSRNKHAPGELPRRAARYCLEAGGLSIDAIDAIAFPWSPASYRRDLPAYLRRTWRTRPARAFGALRRCARERRQREARIQQLLRELGGEPPPPLVWVDHHRAHAASAYHASGWPDAAILTIDGSGEFTSTYLAEGRGGAIRGIHRIVNPDSLGFFYSTVTEFLGFDRDDGEFKTMGMSAYGDPDRADISPLLRWSRNGHPAYRINDDLVWCVKRKRWDATRVFGAGLVDHWGPPRVGDEISEPYTHIAAATQKALEDVVLTFVNSTLRPVLERAQGRLCLAGGCALNVRLNQRLLAHPDVEEVWVQPAAHDAGAPLGAALAVAHARGEAIAPLRDVYLGPHFDDDDIRAVLDRFGIPHRRYDEPALITRVVRLLERGEVVAWFQGRMEFGPRALGNRSILGNPFFPGTSARINTEIKQRETWRPFCPSLSEEIAAEVLGSRHPSPFMTLAFPVSPTWRDRIPEAVHVDGTARPQIVDRDANPRFHRLVAAFGRRTGIPVLLNTSLNRRGEPMVCSPADALHTFYGSGLRYLAIGDRLVAKDPRQLADGSAAGSRGDGLEKDG